MRRILTGYRPIIFGIAILMFLIMTGCAPENYQGSFLVSWSQDGKQAAAVPNLLEEIDRSGLWIFDAESGYSRQIFTPEDGIFCFHPQWSPYDDRILFGTIRKDEEDKAGTKADESLVPYSVWMIGADGRGLNKILDGLSLGGGSNALLMHNTIAWGPSPQSIIVQSLADDGKVTAMLVDLIGGGRREFLPHAADAYSLEISPSHQKAAVILYDCISGTAGVFLKDFGGESWQPLGSFGYDSDQLEAHSQMIFWAPDSSVFVVPEKTARTNAMKDDSFDLRLFDVSSERSRTLAEVSPKTALIWNEAGTGFYFSGASDTNGEGAAIYRVDRETGQITVISAQNDRLLSVDQASERIYFYREERIRDKVGKEDTVLRRMRSCAANGTDQRDLGPWLEGDRSMIWSASPNGQRLMLLNRDPELFNLIELELLSACGFL